MGKSQRDDFADDPRMADLVGKAVGFVGRACGDDAVALRVAVERMPGMADRVVAHVGWSRGFAALLAEGTKHACRETARAARGLSTAVSSDSSVSAELMAGVYACVALMACEAAGEHAPGSREQRAAMLAGEFYGRVLGLGDALSTEGPCS